MKHSTTIKHHLRIEMKLTMPEYAVCDTMHKNPKISIKKISEALHIEKDKLDQIIKKLVVQSFLVMDEETNKIRTAERWWEGNQTNRPPAAIVKKKDPSEFHITYKFKMKVLEIKPDYQYDGMNMKISEFLISKFRSGFKIRQGREATDDEIIASFERFMQLLPPRWKDKPWDLKKLNQDYNLIVDEIKRNSRGKFADSAAEIQKSMQALSGVDLVRKKDY